MLAKLHSSLTILAVRPPATSDQVAIATNHFGSLPEEYVQLVGEGTEIELGGPDNAYIRIWGPEGCVDMEQGYNITHYLPGAIPVGDNGGCDVIYYGNGEKGFGVYKVGLSNPFQEYAVWLADSLTSFLVEGVGIDKIWD